ncbi:glycophorin-A [Heterocephalus glaber]|uniref:Glycophorin-A n=1 Tax=Heterocephalus glaber TaxID=10181 RepID=A0AAX6Q982_HETGA|nr:glycophorin-A [Heterocephalus glaber]
MYEKITIAVLLSGYIFTSTSILATSPAPSTTEIPVSLTVGPGHTMTAEDTAVSDDPYIPPKLPAPRRKQLVHMFSEPVIIAIILGVIAAIVGVILSFAVCVQLLTKKSPGDKLPPLEDTGEPLSSVEVEYTEE